MNLKSLRGLALFLIVCGIAQAADVNVDWDKSANFANYKTYAWGQGTPVPNPLMDQRVVEGIDKRLAAKGLQKVDANNNPDLIVLYHAASSTQVQVNTMNSGGWGWYWGGGMSTTSVEKIPVGQLSVDIGDAKTHKLLWLGTASDTISDKPEKNEKKINNVLDKMFKKFPPPKKD